ADRGYLGVLKLATPAASLAMPPQDVRASLVRPSELTGRHVGRHPAALDSVRRLYYPDLKRSPRKAAAEALGPQDSAGVLGPFCLVRKETGWRPKRRGITWQTARRRSRRRRKHWSGRAG